jgi:molybdenum cofactor cytidylyltransferase
MQRWPPRARPVLTSYSSRSAALRARGAPAGGVAAPIGICRYRDGLGHPFWFSREVFAELLTLHGDKAVWKLLHSGRYGVTELDVDADIPIDVDTWDDYQTLLAQHLPAAR